MNSSWGEITIGGTITKTLFEELKKAIETDIGSCEPGIGGWARDENYLIFNDSDLPGGEFRATEELCFKNNIPFHRESNGEEPEIVVFDPFNVLMGTHSYTINSRTQLLTEAEELMELRDALKEVSITNAPTFINDKRPLFKRHAEHLLSGEDFKGFIIELLDSYLPPPMPELPHFKVKGK